MEEILGGAKTLLKIVKKTMIECPNNPVFPVLSLFDIQTEGTNPI